MTAAWKIQEKNNMLVFKTQMDGVDTDICNQIAKAETG